MPGSLRPSSWLQPIRAEPPALALRQRKHGTPGRPGSPDTAPSMRPMRFSIWPNLFQPWADVLAVARHAESTGWDGLWVADHFMGDGGGFGPEKAPVLEATAVLAGLATATERLRIGPLVLGSTYRHPAVVANWAA